MNKLTSTLTDRYQTTIPREIRSFLNLDKGAQIQYLIDPSGKVYLQNESTNELNEDPVLYSFLEFMEQDMRKSPKRIQPLAGEVMQKVQHLIKDVDVDLDQPI
jgi:antitoxin PrlF